jgi:DNA-binding GntR family transcriptional regulator
MQLIKSSDQKLTCSDLVYRHVTRLIFNGRLLPGERILEDEIATTLQVSKTPVREALIKLAGDHLIESRGRMGTYVTKIPDGEIIALYEARLVVEPPLAKWAAERADDKQIEILERSLALQRTAFRNADNENFLEQDRCFHEQVACMANNPIMLQVRRSISNKVALMQAISFLSRQNNSSTAVREHEEIVLAISQRDGAAASKMMHIHIENLLNEKRLMVERRAEKFQPSHPL